MISNFSREKSIASLRFLSDQSFNHIFQRQLFSANGLAIKDFSQPPQPINFLVIWTATSGVSLRHQLEHAIYHWVTKSKSSWCKGIEDCRIWKSRSMASIFAILTSICYISYQFLDHILRFLKQSNHMSSWNQLPILLAKILHRQCFAFQLLLFFEFPDRWFHPTKLIIWFLLQIM